MTQIMTQKLNPVELLFNPSNLNNTGYLEFTKGSVSWRIYLQEGKLKYVDCSLQLLTQFKYYLFRQGWIAAVEACKDIPQSYLQTKVNPEQDSFHRGLYEQAIVWLLAEKHLDRFQVVQLIEDITQDFLESCLWLTEGTCSWHEIESIPFWVNAEVGNSLSLNLSDLVDFLQQRLKGWQSCPSSLLSPHQRPYFFDYRDIAKAPPSEMLSHEALSQLAQLMRRGLSFRQLSLFVHQDELHVAQILSSYIENKMILLRNPQPPLDQLPNIPRPSQVKEPENSPQISKAVKTYKIVSIDDSPTILSEIQRFLPKERFEVTAINDPVQASSVIFRLEPDLILLDITMPRINGYKLCSLLRSSNVFNETPIIMVTGNTGLIDKARAKLAGATDYLTKPFTQEGLMAIIDKYLE